jgi:hypothetical protein
MFKRLQIGMAQEYQWPQNAMLSPAQTNTEYKVQ